MIGKINLNIVLDKILAGIACLALLVTLGTIGYNEFAQQEIKVVVNLKDNEDPFFALRQIVPVDCRLKEIRQIDKTNNQYELTLFTRREKNNLLEWLLKSSRVEEAEIKNKVLKKN
jgi:hypothetical protein